ncbi:MAG: hypothetical protein DCC49_12945 [Acidobacteria bacterium]|nr:MAG: hypothetical protein DCC49_12945 [Acidobacteriota bacterium]
MTNPATGLIHMGARMYQPKLGRFLSRDPITGGSANDYEYTSGDPINRLDVSGMTHSCNSWHRPDLCNQESEDEICQFVVERDLMDAAAFYCHTTSSGGGVKRVRGKGGNVFVISTRTGRLMKVELGSANVSRRVADWGDVRRSTLSQLPLIGGLWDQDGTWGARISRGGFWVLARWGATEAIKTAARTAGWFVTPIAMTVAGAYNWSGQCSVGYCGW